MRKPDSTTNNATAVLRDSAPRSDAVRRHTHQQSQRSAASGPVPRGDRQPAQHRRCACSAQHLTECATSRSPKASSFAICISTLCADGSNLRWPSRPPPRSNLASATLTVRSRIFTGDADCASRTFIDDEPWVARRARRQRGSRLRRNQLDRPVRLAIPPLTRRPRGKEPSWPPTR